MWGRWRTERGSVQAGQWQNRGGRTLEGCWLPLSVGLDASSIPRCRAVQMGGRRSPWALIALMDTEKVQEQTEGRARARGAPPAGLGQLPGEPLPRAAIPGVSGASPGPSRSIPLSLPCPRDSPCGFRGSGRAGHAAPGLGKWRPRSKGHQIPVYRGGRSGAGGNPGRRSRGRWEWGARKAEPPVGDTSPGRPRAGGALLWPLGGDDFVYGNKGGDAP